MMFVFKAFHMLNADERKEHLQYIKDVLFPDVKLAEKQEIILQQLSVLQVTSSGPIFHVVETIPHDCKQASEFLKQLKQLPCLEEPHNGQVFPISEFSDPNHSVFQMFPEDFKFPSEEYRSDKWLHFFVELGLKTKLEAKQFVHFCTIVAAGMHPRLQQASDVLLKHLFSAEEWHHNRSLLTGIGKICFARAEKLPQLSWIKAPYPPQNHELQLTTLQGAAALSCARLVWTVKPVVNVPQNSELQERLGMITEPTAEDVYRNIVNIADTVPDSSQLFTKYDPHCKYDPGSQSQRNRIDHVMSANLAYLHVNERENVKHFPLFKAVNGTYTSVHGKKVYILPDGCCMSGFEKWDKSESVVFLEKKGIWRKFYSDISDLGGVALSSRDVYTMFVFKAFLKLSADERREHLRYIKDVLFQDAKTHSGQHCMFLQQLRQVPCLDDPNSGCILPIHKFCNPKVSVFQMFSKHFKFPNEEYHNDKWLRFLMELGLKINLEANQFIDFCTNVASGEHPRLEQASAVLLEYLFSVKAVEWHHDPLLLSQIGSICFARTETLPQLSWIKAPCPPQNRELQLATLQGAAVLSCARLVWTIKPVVNVPQNRELQEKLGMITEPTAEDVYRNIGIIADTVPDSSQLFTKYDLHYSYDPGSQSQRNKIDHVMSANLTYLHVKQCEKLKHLPVFKTVDGTCTSVHGKKVYILLEGCCMSGFEKWGKSECVVFLEKKGIWRKFYSDISDLGGVALSSRDVYTMFVFKAFLKLSADERREHLRYIKDVLFQDAKTETEQHCMFLQQLRQVPCLDDPNSGQILPIHKFCNPKISVFQMFRRHFKFPNEEYHNDKWLRFLVVLGLKINLEANQFIDFCTNVASGDHPSLEQASDVLLEYLFSVKAVEWHHDPLLLSQIGSICFARTETLPQLSWIKAPCPPQNCELQLTTLQGAAVLSCARLVWTIKPVVNVPQNRELQERLGMITEPTAEDVYRNIVNIADTVPDSSQLFTKYDPHYSYDPGSQSQRNNIVHVMSANLTYLHVKQREKIKHLPVFKAVNGTYTSVHGKKTYILPEGCMSGFEKWDKSENDVFLEKKGIWRKFYFDISDLGGVALSSRDVYMMFVFKAFLKLSADERREHLRYIKDVLFQDAKTHSGQHCMFLQQLRQVPCLDDPNSGCILPIHKFCNPKVSVFQMFRKHFKFPNEEYHNDKWLHFLVALGLKINLEANQFIDFCTNVASGSHPSLKQASDVLLEYLFSVNAVQWHLDPLLLSQIGSICFARTETLPQLSWIKAPCPPQNHELQLTTLQGAAVLSCARLVWTVKPVVNVPQNRELQEKLGMITEPTAEDVYRNIVNIADTVPDSSQLFTKYDPHYSYASQSQTSQIDRVMSVNLTYLHRKERERIKHLPLFKAVNGTYTSVHGKKVYILPDGCCITGVEKWTKHESVVFLEKIGIWRKFYSDIFDLGGVALSSRDVYTMFVFNAFLKLSADERREHLQYIKDVLFQEAKTEIEQHCEFLRQLRQVPCLDDPNSGRILPIHEFCNPKCSVFQMFPQQFSFPSEAYQSEEWLEFFINLGLKTNLKANQFIGLCNSVASGDHPRSEQASDVLLEYLFSVKAVEWHHDPLLLSQIGSICFARTETLPQLSWIKAPCPPQNCELQLTTLQGAAVLSCARLVWTIKPVVNVPQNRELQEKLGMITEPTAEDVYRNIGIIADTVPDSSQLFAKYDPHYSYDPGSQSQTNQIDQLMSDNLTYLHRKEHERIKHLPLFKAVNGTYTSVHGKEVYILPDGCCITGVEKWAKSESVVFLEKIGVWRNFYSDISDLGGVALSSRDVYTMFVFKAFLNLSADERREHLQYIKDVLFQEAKTEIEQHCEFLRQLRQVPCLDDPNSGRILPIHEFCNPKCSVFQMFPQQFSFPSEAYQSEEWLEFFINLGLKTNLKVNQFIGLCNSVASGSHPRSEQASDVLLEYLFSVKAVEWHHDPLLLSQIGSICFARTETLPRLSWIKAPCPPQNCELQLTTLQGAAVLSCARLVWTIKPVVNVPQNRELQERLGMITEPTAEDVYRNIAIIADTVPDSSQLFAKYDPHYSYDPGSQSQTNQIDQLMSDNLTYLHRKEHERIKHLPLFKAVNGTYTSVHGKEVYILPDGCCITGVEKWAKSESVVFLEKIGVWRNFYSDISDLGGVALSSRDVYTMFVFNAFLNLSADERREHLQYIKDVLFQEAKTEIEQHCEFLRQLRQVPCLDDPNSGRILPIHEFCNPKCSVFQMFPQQFNFPSEAYQSEEWLEFFINLGLKTNLKANQFIGLCNSVASGDHPRSEQASDVLLKYLFSVKAVEWHRDPPLLSQIGSICFARAEKLPPLSWIQAPCPPKNHELQLTTLQGAAVLSCARLVWTVMPVVNVPQLSSSDLPVCRDIRTFNKNLQESLGMVTEANAEDVYRNIINISNSGLASFQLFTKYNQHYTCESDSQRDDIVQVVSANLSYLHERNGEKFKALERVSCIPVSADGSYSMTTIACPVLVNSLQVVMRPMKGSELCLRPYISALPTPMSSIANLLNDIGVTPWIRAKHLQHILEFLHNQQGKNPLLPYQLTKVRAAIMKLAEFCTKNRDEVSTLKELYLPCHQGTLVKSTNLLFNDSRRYKELGTLDFSDTGYQLFSLPPDVSLCAKEEFDDPQETRKREWLEKEMCSSLPEEVRPRKFTMSCEEKILGNAEVDTNTSLCEQILKMKELHCEIKQTLLHLLFSEKCAEDEESCEQFAEAVGKILETMKVQVIKNLEVEVLLTLVSPPALLGTRRVPFLLHKKVDGSLLLSLDSGATEGGYVFWNELSRHMYFQVAKIPVKDPLLFCDCLSKCLGIVNIDDLAVITERLSKKVDTEEQKAQEPDCDAKSHLLEIPKLGHDIPDSLLHCLDHGDISHTFHPQEWVGHAIEENRIVFAIVLHPKLSEGEAVQGMYLIRVSEREEPLIETSVLDLYKIIESKKPAEAAKGRECVPLEVSSADTTVEHQKIMEGQGQENSVINLVRYQPKPDKEEAQRWLKQAEAECCAMRVLRRSLQFEPKVACSICFIAHQVVENALKAGMYDLLGLNHASIEYRDLSCNASAIWSEKHTADTRNLCSIASTLEQHYESSHRPNVFDPPDAPVDVYTVDKAEECAQKAEEALAIIQQLMVRERAVDRALWNSDRYVCVAAYCFVVVAAQFIGWPCCLCILVLCVALKLNFVFYS